jgi:hypothetical protein
MNRPWLVLAAIAIATLTTTQTFAQNQLANPGFELPTSDTTSVGNWFRFGSAPDGFAVDSTVDPHSGLGHMDVNTIGANQFAGVFQSLPVPVNPGNTVTFSGWHKTTTTPFNGTIELKIEWTGAPQNRLDVLSLGTDYEPFTHTGVAPAGTTGATITYAISSFSAGQNGNVQVFVDDLSAVVIPEPASASMLIVGLLAVGRGLRRRR